MEINTNERAQDGWWIILALLYDLPLKEWDEFTRELIYKNRFTVSHKVVDVIQRSAINQTRVINKGQLLYRARIYKQDPLNDFVYNAFKLIVDDNSEFAGNSDAFKAYNKTIVAAVLNEINNKTPRGLEIVNLYKKWRRKKFKGYNAKESGMPPVEKASSGRINPEKICYLYLSEDVNTAVYEVRPIIGQHVSIATFKTKEDLKIYDLTIDSSTLSDDNQNKDSLMLDVIQNCFSTPNTGSAIQYLPTQYLSEKIKLMGFDGLRFRSSLKAGGVNVVLFEDKKCKAIHSDIIKVGAINVSIEKPDIYLLEEYLN